MRGGGGVWVSYIFCEILEAIFVLKPSRNAMKHVINEGGGHI